MGLASNSNVIIQLQVETSLAHSALSRQVHEDERVQGLLASRSAGGLWT